jgi:hypothetical protein
MTLVALVVVLLPAVAEGHANDQDACAPGYSPCLPVVGDLDCDQIPASKKPVRVTGSDQYRLDDDGDGLGCENDDGAGGTRPVPVFLSARQAHYDRRSAVERIHAFGVLARGLASARQATYRDTGHGAPWARVTLSVYTNALDADRAFGALCPPTRCSKSAVAAKQGIALRFRAFAGHPGNCVRLASQRKRVVVLVETCAVVNDDTGKPYTVAMLKYDAAFLVGAFHARAK